MKLDELKSCPFCGGGDIRIDGHDMRESPTGKVFSMCCYHCGATFPNRYKRELLVASWNTRAALPSDDALIDLMRRTAVELPISGGIKFLALDDIISVIRQHQSGEGKDV